MRRTNEGLAGNVFMSTVDAVNTGAVKQFLLDLQARICEQLAAEEDEAGFVTDRWDRGGGGGGVSRVLSEGAVFEKAGVNFSHVFGDSLPPSATATRPELAGRSYQAMGISLVIHPRNPFVPTSHANFRLFATTGDDPAWWFGGGYDLTPYYGFDEDCIHWHRTAREACERFGPEYYPRFKDNCDAYFHLRHRGERRESAACFLTISTKAVLTTASLLSAAWPGVTSMRICPLSSAASICPGPGSSAGFRNTAGAATSNSIWFTTGARSSGCSPASAESSRF